MVWSLRGFVLAAGLAMVASAAGADSFEYRYTKTKSDGSPQYAECSNPITGGVLAHGQALRAWRDASVGWDEACASEMRQCVDGVLSGSFLATSCAPAIPLSCAFPGGGTVAHEQSVEAFATTSVAWSQTCLGEFRTCTNGELSGSFTATSCTVLPPVACNLPWGGTIPHAGTVTAWAAATVGAGGSCTSQVRTCSDAVLSGTYAHQACVVLEDHDPIAFTLSGQANGSPGVVYASFPVQIQHVTGNVPVSLSNYANDAQIQVCSDATCASVLTAWTGAPVTVMNSQYVQVRARASATLGGTVTKTVTVGNFQTSFTINTTTVPCGGIDRMCDDGSVYIGKYDNKHLAVTRCDAGQTWNGTSCTGSRIGNLVFGPVGAVISSACTAVGGAASGCRDGQTNTAQIAAQGAAYTAANYCANLVLGGQTDWFLPAVNQWDVVINVPNNQANLVASLYYGSAHYHTSSETDVTGHRAWVSRPTNSYTNYRKDRVVETKYVRCMRVIPG